MSDDKSLCVILDRLVRNIFGPAMRLSGYIGIHPHPSGDTSVRLRGMLCGFAHRPRVRIYILRPVLRVLRRSIRI